MPYKSVEGFAMADVAFEASGKTLEELFASCGEALTSTMIKDPKELGVNAEKRFTLEAKDAEFLLHDFLQELLYLKDAELLLFREYKLKIEKAEKGMKLTATMLGDHLDPTKQTLLIDAKAVSWHMFKVEKSNVWKAFFIVDL